DLGLVPAAGNVGIDAGGKGLSVESRFLPGHLGLGAFAGSAAGQQGQAECGRPDYPEPGESHRRVSFRLPPLPGRRNCHNKRSVEGFLTVPMSPTRQRGRQKTLTGASGEARSPSCPRYSWWGRVTRKTPAKS